MAESSLQILTDVDTSKTPGDTETKYHDPQEAGFFSVDANDEFIPDQSQLKYYANPKQYLKSNLEEGFESFHRKETEKFSNDLTPILQWILLDPSRIKDEEFVTRRGALINLCTTRWLKEEQGWNVWVEFFKGKYYMGVKANFSAEQWRRDRKRDYRAFKFEQISTSDEPGGVPDLSAPVNSNLSFYRVLQARLSTADKTNHCIHGESVELKTYSQYKPKQTPTWFSQMKCWLQSYISGTPTIVFGFLSADGILERVEEKDTKDIYTEWMSRMRKFPWHPVCFDFLANFLRAVKRVVTKEHPCAIFTFKAFGPVQYSLLKPHEHFLPKWYMSKM